MLFNNGENVEIISPSIVTHQINKYLSVNINNITLFDEQVSIISNILSGRDVLAVLPTGAGKTLGFVLLPLLMNHVRQIMACKCYI